MRNQSGCNRVKTKKKLRFFFLVLCKYALLHTSISCYTSTVTSMFHIAVCHTPCGVSINKDTCDQLYFSSVFCACKTSSNCVAPPFMCVPLPVVTRDIFKELHLTETGTQSTKVPVVRFRLCPQGNSLCDTG